MNFVDESDDGESAENAFPDESDSSFEGSASSTDVGDGDPFAEAAMGREVHSTAHEGAAAPKKSRPRRTIVAEREVPAPSTVSSRRMLSSDASGEIDSGMGRVSDVMSTAYSSASQAMTPASVSGVPSTSGAPPAVSVALPSNAAGSSALVKGVAKNVMQDTERRGVIVRWFRALFLGSNFAVDRDITEFQVFPDFSGTTLNSSGNQSDQVIMYGKIQIGAISQNNDVEVYGHRDKNGNIVAKQVKNLATGSIVKPSIVLSRSTVIAITLILTSVVAMIYAMYGIGFFVSIFLLVLFIILLPAIIKLIFLILMLFK